MRRRTRPHARWTEVAEALGDLEIEPYQRERIRIDVIYHHPDNQQLIDEYKRILASCAGSTIDSSARARLMRLRTLSLRNEVPLSIFDTLEEIVLQEPRAVTRKEDEPDYIQSTREILGGFLLGRNITRKLSSLDLVQLMENKQKAASNRDQTFEELLLETGRLIDEIGREEEDFERLESFGELVTLFDRIDHTTTLVNKMAFMDDVELSPEQVRSLLGNMQVFEKLRARPLPAALHRSSREQRIRTRVRQEETLCADAGDDLHREQRGVDRRRGGVGVVAQPPRACLFRGVQPGPPAHV